MQQNIKFISCLLLVLISCLLTTATNNIYTPTNICANTEFDYTIEPIENGYKIHFFDKTENGFIAYTNINWSTTIPHPTDILGSSIPSESETIRLKKNGSNTWTTDIHLETIINSLDTIDTTTIPSTVNWDINDEKIMNEIKLRFYFQFWAIDGTTGEHQICNSPFIIV